MVNKAISGVSGCPVKSDANIYLDYLPSLSVNDRTLRGIPSGGGIYAIGNT